MDKTKSLAAGNPGNKKQRRGFAYHPDYDPDKQESGQQLSKERDRHSSAGLLIGKR